MVKIIHLLSSWRECCNLVHDQCAIVIKDKCKTMNWAHIVSLYIYEKNICPACMRQTGHMNMKQTFFKAFTKIEIKCVTEKWEGHLQWRINFYGNMDALRSQLNVFYKAWKYVGQWSLCFVNNSFYFCPCKNSTCAPTANNWNVASNALAFSLDLSFTTVWNPTKVCGQWPDTPWIPVTTRLRLLQNNQYTAETLKPARNGLFSWLSLTGSTSIASFRWTTKQNISPGFAFLAF